MRRLLTTVASLALVTSAPGLASVAFAHGGSYRGPAGEVPPDSREPSDPPPPPEGGGPQTPGGDQPGGPTTGAPDGGGPTTGGGSPSGPGTGGSGGTGPSGPPSTGGGGPATGGGKKPSGNRGPGYEDWTFWWNDNKDELLQVKSRVKAMQRGATSGAGSAFGGKKKAGQGVVTATDEAIQQKIIPALHALLEQKDISYHIQSAAELGLAKIGDATIIETLKTMASNKDKAYHREVQESA